MNVLFVHDHKFYESNGIYYSIKFSKETWKPYIMNGNTVIVYARKSMKPCSQRCVSEGVTFQLTDLYSSSFSVMRNYGQIENEITKIIKECDCIIVRMPSVLGIIAVKVAKQMNKKILAEVVGDAYDAYKYYGNIKGKILAPIFKYLNKRAIDKCNAALYVTNQYLQNLYPNKGYTIGCSDVLIEDVSELVLEKRIEKIRNNSRNTFICGEIGNVSVSYKGYEVMIKAMKILKEENINIEFHIVGGGNPENLTKMAQKYGVQNSVIYKGMVEHEKINQFYDNIDIYVHPSFTEGLPRVVIEAISRGCPCVVSNIGGMPELIEEKYTHKSGDEIELANDIKKLYTNGIEMERVAKYNFEHAKKYSSSSLKKKRMDFYKNFFRL